jgi:hypothetical protein
VPKIFKEVLIFLPLFWGYLLNILVSSRKVVGSMHPISCWKKIQGTEESYLTSVVLEIMAGSG